MYYYNWNLAARDAISKDPNYFKSDVEKDNRSVNEDYENKLSDGKGFIQEVTTSV